METMEEESTINKKKEVFDGITLGIVNTLQKRPGVCDVQLVNRPPVERHMLLSWEQKFTCMMPEDLKNFYLTTDGLLLTWNVKLNGSSARGRRQASQSTSFRLEDAHVNVGRMELNSVSNLVRLAGVGTPNPSSITLADIITDSDDDEDTDPPKPKLDHRSRIFELDPCQGNGKVCLVFMDTKVGVPAQKHSIWFLDRSLEWHYLTDSFLNYYRLMLMHLGLPQWQYGFTDIGISPQAKQWFNMYAPIRLEQDSSVYEQIDQTESTGVNPVSTLDVAKVFKGKTEKKKPTPATTNQPGKKRGTSGSARLGPGSRGTSQSQHGRPIR